MTDAGTTQDNFILPAPPVEGLPISQDWLDRWKSHNWQQNKLGGCAFHSQSVVERKEEGNVLFNDAFNTFYLRLYGVRHMVKDHTDSERGNPLLPHGLLFLISNKGSFICIIPQSG